MTQFLSPHPLCAQVFIIIRTVEWGLETDSNCFISLVGTHAHSINTLCFWLSDKGRLEEAMLDRPCSSPCHRLPAKWVSRAGSSRNRTGRAVSGSCGCWYFSRMHGFLLALNKLWFLASRSLASRLLRRRVTPLPVQ